jgi:hypothetical protein
MFDVFYEQRPMTTDDIVNSIQKTVPLSKTMSENMDELRDWAQGRARSATSQAREDSAGSGKRQIEI